MVSLRRPLHKSANTFNGPAWARGAADDFLMWDLALIVQTPVVRIVVLVNVLVPAMTYPARIQNSFMMRVNMEVTMPIGFEMAYVSAVH